MCVRSSALLRACSPMCWETPTGGLPELALYRCAADHQRVRVVGSAEHAAYAWSLGWQLLLLIQLPRETAC